MGIKNIVYRGRGSLREKTEECKDHRLYRATPSGRDTAKLYKYRFLFIFFLTTCFTSVLVFITNSYYGSVLFLVLLTTAVWFVIYFNFR